MRAGEAHQLRWTDLDLVNSTIRVTPEKHSNPRIFKLGNRLISMINRLPKDHSTLFGSSKLNHLRKTCTRQRKRLAHKFGNPKLQQITLHTLRHWKATIEYHKTQDILYVMQLLGHKNIKNTLIYTQLIQFQDNDYLCKATRTIDEAKVLIEAGFEYICDIESAKQTLKTR